MATWKKINTSNTNVNKMVATANSKAGYRMLSSGNYRWGWCVPSSYYGWRRNNRANHLLGGPNSSTSAINSNLPANISGQTPFDYFFEKDMKITTSDTMKVHWHSSSNYAVFPRSCKLYFAPILIPPDTVNTYRFVNHNYLSIPNSDFEYLFDTGHDGSSTTRGIVKADLNTIVGYTANDSTYSFGFQFTFPTEKTIKAGAALLMLITCDAFTSSSGSKYMRNFTVTISGEET